MLSFVGCGCPGEIEAKTAPRWVVFVMFKVFTIQTVSSVIMSFLLSILCVPFPKVVISLIFYLSLTLLCSFESLGLILTF